VVEKGHNQRLGKSGKRHPKEFGEPVGEPGSLAGAAAEPRRCRRIDRRFHSRRTEHVWESLHVRESLVGAATVVHNIL